VSGSDTLVAPSSHTPFHLGRVVITPAARDQLAAMGLSPNTYLTRHRRNDWGDLSADDAALNGAALADGNHRLFSSYHLDPEADDPEANRLWIITEHDRSVTTILLPSDY